MLLKRSTFDKAENFFFLQNFNDAINFNKKIILSKYKEILI